MPDLKKLIEEEIKIFDGYFSRRLILTALIFLLVFVVIESFVVWEEILHFSYLGILVFLLIAFPLAAIVYSLINNKKKHGRITKRLKGYLENEKIQSEWTGAELVYESNYIKGYSSPNYIYITDLIHHVGIDIFQKGEISKVNLKKERNWGSRHSHTHYMWLLDVLGKDGIEYKGIFSFRYNDSEHYDEKFHKFAVYLGSLADEYIENI